jgi:hypothetical protein
MTGAGKAKEKQSRPVAQAKSQMRVGAESVDQGVDNRPEAVAQRKLQDMANHSRAVAQLRAFQEMASNGPRAKEAAQLKVIADHYSERHQRPVQREESAIGLPCDVNSGAEGLSDVSIGRQTAPCNSSFSAKPNAAMAQARHPVQLSKYKSKGPKVKKKKKIKPGLLGRTMIVRNKIKNYSSGRINSLYRSTGVEPAPRKEAQKVALLLGGSWVGGHMINDQLGGGGGFKNIVPITSSMNGLHRTMENRANDILSAGNGAVIEYKMNILKRATVEHKAMSNTVKNVPIEFQQTIDVFYKNGTTKKIIGSVLEEDRPGGGVVKP